MEVKRILGSLARVERDADILAKGDKLPIASRRPTSNLAKTKQPSRATVNDIKENSHQNKVGGSQKTAQEKIQSANRAVLLIPKSTTQIEEVARERDKIIDQEHVLQSIGLLHYLTALFAVRKKRLLKAFIENARFAGNLKTRFRERINRMCILCNKFDKRIGLLALSKVPHKNHHDSFTINDKNEENIKESTFEPSHYFMEMGRNFRQFTLLAKALSILKREAEVARPIKESLATTALRQKVAQFSNTLSRIVNENVNVSPPQDVKDKKVLARLREIEERRAKAKRRMNEIRRAHEKKREEKLKEESEAKMKMAKDQGRLKEDELALRKEKLIFEKCKLENREHQARELEKRRLLTEDVRKKWQKKLAFKNLLSNVLSLRKIGFDIQFKKDQKIKFFFLSILCEQSIKLQDKQIILKNKAVRMFQHNSYRRIFRILSVNLVHQENETKEEGKMIRRGFLFRRWQKRMIVLKVENYEREMKIQNSRQRFIFKKTFGALRTNWEEVSQKRMEEQTIEATKLELKNKAQAWLSEFRSKAK
jgi:hypothetical protein